MKKIYILLTAILAIGSVTQNYAQTLNWSGIQPWQRHLVNVNVGWDYAAATGLGYGYLLKTKMPSMFNAQISIPAGKTRFDDFKAKLGYQVRAYKAGNFMATVTANGIFRRYQSNVVRLENFGAEFVGVAGYYRPRWFAAGEFGFDKAITTQVRNSELSRQYYPNSRDGWYVPTGGNFQYGIQAGYSFRSVDVYVKGGKTVDQNFRSAAIVPFYFQMGVNARF